MRLPDAMIQPGDCGHALKPWGRAVLLLILLPSWPGRMVWLRRRESPELPLPINGMGAFRAPGSLPPSPASADRLLEGGRGAPTWNVWLSLRRSAPAPGVTGLPLRSIIVTPAECVKALQSS